jgi:acetyltransferase-like isoleucine patch superfamily enzyme
MKMLMLKIKRKLNRYLKSNEYVALNDTITLARAMGVRVGNGCRIYSTNFSTEPYLITIGDHVTITDNVQFITHDGAVWVFRENKPDLDLFGKIKIGNNVFIGLNTILLPGTEIGDNVIIAAGSVLKGTYPGNSLIAGVPGKRICSIEDYYQKNIDKFVSVKGITGAERDNKIIQLIK